MSTFDLAALVAAHSRFPAALEALLAAEDDDLLRRRPAEGRWSPLEILAHLLDEEREDFRPRAQAAAAGEPITTAIDPQGWVAARAYNDQDPAALLRAFAAERAASCAWIASLAPEALDRVARHAKLGDFRCADFLAAWRMHDLLHARQLAMTLAQLHARAFAGLRVDYAGAIPA